MTNFDALLSGKGGSQSQQAPDLDALLDEISKPKTAPGTDFFKSIPTGVSNAWSGLMGAQGDVAAYAAKGLDYLFGEGTGAKVNPGPNSILHMPTSSEVSADTESHITGPLHQPEGTAGKWGRATGEAVPALVGGPSALLRYGLTSSYGSEAAGEATEGTPYETAARIAGGFAGPMAMERGFPTKVPQPGATPVPQRDVVGPTPDRGYPGVPALRPNTQPEAYAYRPGVEPPRPQSRPAPIDTEGDIYSTPPNAAGMREEVGPSPGGYPNLPVPAGQPFTHWPETEGPTPPPPPPINRPPTDRPITGGGPPNPPQIAGGVQVPQPPVPRAGPIEDAGAQPRTTTVGKQPKDTQVFGDFEVGDSTSMTHNIGGQNMTIDTGKIAELFLKPEKVLKQNMTGQGASRTAVTEQVPYARMTDGREIKLSQLKKSNPKQESPTEAPKHVDPEPVISAGAVKGAIKKWMNETRKDGLNKDLKAGRLYFSDLQRELPGLSRKQFDKAFKDIQNTYPHLVKDTDKVKNEQFIVKRNLSPEENKAMSNAKKDNNWNKLVGFVRGEKNKKFTYMHNFTKFQEKSGAGAESMRINLNKLIKAGKVKIYPEGEPDNAVIKVDPEMFHREAQDFDYVVEFID